MIDAVGGIPAWGALPDSEKENLAQATYERLCDRFGQQVWNSLADNERNQLGRLVWHGCGMHKEMNSVKGGADNMTKFWPNSGFPPPVKLLNRDKAAAVLAGPSAAHDQALATAVGGGVKLTTLAGQVFHHKDNKLGQQDTFRIFFERRLGYMVRFPDTSSIRFQCQCDAAAELIVHLPLYLEFLNLVKFKKDSHSLNHMESNVLRGLQCPSTLTELCVLTLYLLAVSQPYMRVVRDGRVNALQLGPWHRKVIAHCDALIASPSLLLGPVANYEAGSLDGRPFHRPEAFFAVQTLLPSLPGVVGCFVDFVKGARAKWIHLSPEHVLGGLIDSMTPAEREKVFIHATNDHCEGALGAYRQALRRAPTMSLLTHNSREMMKKNDTETFIKHELTEKGRKFLRMEARRLDSLKLEKRNRQAQAEYDAALAAENQGKDTVRQEKAATNKAELEAMVPSLDVDELKRNFRALTNTEITRQINWHRQFTTNIPTRTLISNMRKSDKFIQLIIAIGRYNQTLVPNASLSPHFEVNGDPEDVPEEVGLPTTPMDWEERQENEYADLDDRAAVESH